MARKMQRKSNNPNVGEATRIRITDILHQFRNSRDEVYTFEADLSNYERAVVHEVCRKMGMKSKSSGRGKERCVSVYKTEKTKVDKMECQNLPHLTFSEETKRMLQDLFEQYPPDEGEERKEMDGRVTGKIYKSKRMRDDMFCKPLLSKTDIAKKVDTLASRMESVANLRLVSEERTKLPMSSFRDVITTTVESHQVVLISGETGCGKTTQVPQFLLDYMWGKGEACKVVCTQPRRISAISVAERISFERGEPIGGDIGYKIRLESKGGRHSSVVFCTNGILLRVLVSKGVNTEEALAKHTKSELSEITHIIVDEIHERDRYSDFMLAIMRDVLPSYPHLRLILMSATLDAERFSEYFGGCPIIRVPGFTYPVKTFYLEDVLSILESKEDNHLDNAILCDRTNEAKIREEDKLSLDDAISSAWLNDEFDHLLELVSCDVTSKLFNYQHSLTGITALMVFAGKGRVEDVCMLLSIGADCQLQAKDGKTALELAEREAHQETAEILKKHMESGQSNSMEQKQLLDTYLEKINPEFIDVVLIEQVLHKICTDSGDGAILVFLSGWDDINKTRDRLLMNPFFKDTTKFFIIALHSMVPSIEQKKVFKRPPPGCRKIVLSTNIAETAVTIDDVVYVIDSGRMKEKSYDPYNNVSTLQSSWVSKASAKQREGRAGRCQPGICYHLFSRCRAGSLPDFQVPEIKRMPIEELCLQVKLLDPDCTIEDFLQKTLDPPVFETIRNAVVVLQDIGALSLEEKLTELGKKLGSLPVHPLTSKMLFFAILMNCLDPALTLACAADYRDPFTLPMLPNEKKKADAARYELASLYGGNSDQLAVIAAYECWKNAKARGQEVRFCSQYFVSSNTMSMLCAMRKQLKMELERNGFISGDASSCSLNAHDPGILRAVLVAGLYPMVGRLLPPHKSGKRLVIETASGDKISLHPHSNNFKLPLKKTDNPLLVVYNEITRVDRGVSIRNCTVVGPLSLLLLSTEIAVAPALNYDDDNNDDESDNDNEDGSDEDAMDVDKNSVVSHEEKIMSSPDNSVTVILDRWLYFASMALDVAQIYCLRERLSAAILFKVTHPREVLPPRLGASVYAVACILSYDGLSGISVPMEPVDVNLMPSETAAIDKFVPKRGSKQNSSGFLKSLMNHGMQRGKGNDSETVTSYRLDSLSEQGLRPRQEHQMRCHNSQEGLSWCKNTISHKHKPRVSAFVEVAKSNPWGCDDQPPPSTSTCMNPKQKPPSQDSSLVGKGMGKHGPHGLRADIHKRMRGNGAW